MGKRNRERVARIQAGLEKPIAMPTDPAEKTKMGLCPFPGCSATQLRAQGAHGFCAAHEKFVADLLFIIPHIKWEAKKSQTGLVLPGQPGFALPTM